jgi:hypothetical protein
VRSTYIEISDFASLGGRAVFSGCLEYLRILTLLEDVPQFAFFFRLFSVESTLESKHETQNTETEKMLFVCIVEFYLAFRVSSLSEGRLRVESSIRSSLLLLTYFYGEHEEPSRGKSGRQDCIHRYAKRLRYPRASFTDSRPEKWHFWLPVLANATS